MSSNQHRLYCTVNPWTKRWVTNLAVVEGVSVSKLVGQLVREGLDRRMREKELLRREFELRAEWPLNLEVARDL